MTESHAAAAAERDQLKRTVIAAWTATGCDFLAPASKLEDVIRDLRRDAEALRVARERLANEQEAHAATGRALRRMKAMMRTALEGGPYPLDELAREVTRCLDEGLSSEHVDDLREAVRNAERSL